MGISPIHRGAVAKAVAALLPALALAACGSGREQELEEKLAAAEEEIQTLTREKEAAEREAARAQTVQAAPGFVEDDGAEMDPDLDPDVDSDPYDDSFAEPQPMMPPPPPPMEGPGN